MIKICLCVKIHIPAVQANYRFSDIRENHRYFDENAAAEHVRNVYKNNLAPFFAGLRSVHYQSDAKFKAGVSASGISLTLLQKYAPKAIEELAQLEKRNCIELLSEPWSHSLLPYFDEQELSRQVDLHDKTVYALFGKIPGLFVVHSPVFKPNIPEMVSSLGKEAVFMNLNPLDDEGFKKMVLKKQENSSPTPVLPINHKLSRMLQKIDLNPFMKSTADFSKRVVNRFKSSVTDSNPVVVMYDITSAKGPFRLSRAVTWKRVLMDLLADKGVFFISPEKAVKSYKSFVNKNNLFRNVIYRSRITNKWLRNKLQKEAFDKQLKINSAMKTEERKLFIKEWDILQDMEYLYYMDNHFNKQEFAESHYNPHPNTNLAFINYINILNDFWHRLQDKKITFKNKAQPYYKNQYQNEK
ncbi:MAG: hypothetical protein ACOC2M_00670 [bacterium]